MDLGGARTNKDLTEAALLLKQSTTTSTATNSAQMQPPPLMMMQQAVAMQQFQFQQALLMQQVMANQQAAARAATVKSAAEMAAARAAEISKQLKGSDAEEEEQKKTTGASPSRSKSMSPSRSRSVSRSKSRSPIRYRRDRSLSRSPIRYRRDRAYSPSWYGYRSRSRRGYYRGRGDYPWQSYRREWDRDRDRDYYPRSRRSRSRSKSRVRRRSRTRSRSPRYRRERTPSPRYRREERRTTRSYRRSRSRDARRSPSLSRSRSGSPRRNDDSRSPMRKLEISGTHAGRREASGSPVLREVRREGKESSGSPATEAQVRAPEATLGESLLQEEERLGKNNHKESDIPSREASDSPARSLSVSLQGSSKKDLGSNDEVDVNSKANKVTTSLWAAEYSGNRELDHPHNNLAFEEDVKAKVSSSDVSSEDANRDTKLKGPLLEKQSSCIKGEELSIADRKFPLAEESEDEKGLDDWRDDMKPSSRERIGRKDRRKDNDRRGEEKKPTKAEVVTMSSYDYARVDPMPNQQDKGNSSKKHAQDSGSLDTEKPDYDSNHERKARTEGGKKELKRQESFRYRGRSPLGKIDETSGRDRRRVLDSDDLEEQDEDIKAGPLKEDDKEDDDVVIAESLPLYEVSKAVRPVLVEDYEDEERVVDKVAASLKAKDDSDLEDDEEVKASQGKSVFDVEDRSVSHKGKDRRFDDEGERDRRRERHKKHKKRRRRDEDDVKDDNDDDDDERADYDGHKEKRRHKRRHRKEEDERKDRKRRKRRSRAKSVSDSDRESPGTNVDASKDDSDRSPVRKKSSSRKKSSGRHKKRKREPSKSPAYSSSSSD